MRIYKSDNKTFEELKEELSLTAREKLELELLALLKCWLIRRTQDGRI